MQMLGMLEGVSCVWTGAGFVAAAEAVLESPADFAPYLHDVPAELLLHTDFFKALGVRIRQPRKCNSQ